MTGVDPGPKITNFYKCTFLKVGCGLHLRLKIGRGFTLFKRNTFTCFAAIFFGAFFLHSCDFFLDGGGTHGQLTIKQIRHRVFAFCNANRLAQFVFNGETRHSLTNVISSIKHMIGLGMESCVTWSGIYFAFFSNPHFPQLQNHSFNLQNHKMSQNHTYFRP